jgi:alpha-L-fucosidase 2
LLTRRGDGGTGWSLGWKVNVQARLHDGDHALKLLRRQLQVVETSEMDLHNGGGTYLNLFCAHPPYQIDGNMAASSGVPRLLIDSALDEITLLPALPSSWKNLTARGLRGANGYTVDLRVRDGKLTDVKLVSGCNRPTRVRVGNREQVLTLAPGETRLATEKTLNSDLLFPEKDQ